MLFEFLFKNLPKHYIGSKYIYMILQHRKKLNILLGLTIAGALIAQSFNIQQPKPKKLVNIKVFPATATYEQVDHAMDHYKVDLGVKCNYCHAPEKDNPRKMDMPSDANPMKEVAREMMRMTNEMNQKYISAIKHPESDSTKIQMITCNTCHRGVPKPFGKPLPAPPPPPPGQWPNQGANQGPKPNGTVGK